MHFKLLTSHRRTMRWTVVLLAAAISLTACASTGDTAGKGATGAAGGAVKIQTAAGTLALDQPASKVAVMQFQFLDMLISLGVHPAMVADDQVAGNSTPLPQQFNGKLGKYVSLGSRLAPNMEALASEPLDLIIVDKNEHLKDQQQFGQYAPTAVFDTSSWADFYPNLQAVGTLVGASAKATAVEAKLKKHFKANKAKLSSRVGARVMVAVATSDKVFSFTGNSLQAGVIKELGLGYAYKDVPGKLTEQVPLESLAADKPDVLILVADHGAALVTDTWKGNSLWDSIPAVKSGAVFTFDRGVWSLGRGPMAVDIMIDQITEKLAK